MVLTDPGKSGFESDLSRKAVVAVSIRKVDAGIL
jgi:hypothetical protein